MSLVISPGLPVPVPVPVPASAPACNTLFNAVKDFFQELFGAKVKVYEEIDTHHFSAKQIHDFSEAIRIVEREVNVVIKAVARTPLVNGYTLLKMRGRDYVTGLEGGVLRLGFCGKYLGEGSFSRAQEVIFMSGRRMAFKMPKSVSARRTSLADIAREERKYRLIRPLAEYNLVHLQKGQTAGALMEVFDGEWFGVIIDIKNKLEKVERGIEQLFKADLTINSLCDSIIATLCVDRGIVFDKDEMGDVYEAAYKLAVVDFDLYGVGRKSIEREFGDVFARVCRALGIPSLSGHIIEDACARVRNAAFDVVNHAAGKDLFNPTKRDLFIAVCLQEELDLEKSSVVNRSVMVQVARELADMHGKEMTDGDVKMENVFLKAMGKEAHICDLGTVVSDEEIRSRLAIARTPIERKRVKTDLCGINTKGYLAEDDSMLLEEAFRVGDVARIAKLLKARDVFALGVSFLSSIIFCSVPQASPGRSSTYASCMLKWYWKAGEMQGYNSAEKELLASMLDRDPDKRSSMTEVVNELRRIENEREEERILALV
jgi:hypothetical protein